ncbi:MAG TPA: FCD domain-containing protein, partial [Acidimicrobiia bacterium]|nr:FCD domain-containing protein [Acidimicrobiia bacterium]
TDEAGGQCAPGATGEIRVRGTNLMRAICGQDPADTFDAEGFYATSDLGALDADGYLWYHGRAAIKELRALIGEEEAVIDDPDAFGIANAAFHERLVALAGNQTLGIVAEMLHEIVAVAVAAVSRGEDGGSLATRRRGLRSQEKLLDLLEAGDGAAAEEHWRSHMQIVGRVMLGQEAATVVDLLDHY